MGANGSIWEQISSHVCSGVHFHGGGRKTRRNGAKSGGQDIFCRCDHEQEKYQVVDRGDWGGSERIQGEYLHAKGVLGYLCNWKTFQRSSSQKKAAPASSDPNRDT